MLSRFKCAERQGWFFFKVIVNFADFKRSLACIGIFHAKSDREASVNKELNDFIPNPCLSVKLQ